MIERIDHLVLTVRSRDVTAEFYQRVLGFTVEMSSEGPLALKFGQQKINVHEIGRSFEPKAVSPTSGAGDFCLITWQPIDAVVAHLDTCSVPVELGPVERQGALGPMTSVYFRDPDGNLVEVSHYATA